MFKSIRRFFHKTFGTCTLGPVEKLYEDIPTHIAFKRTCTHPLCSHKDITSKGDLEIKRWRDKERAAAEFRKSEEAKIVNAAAKVLEESVTRVEAAPSKAETYIDPEPVNRVPPRRNRRKAHYTPTMKSRNSSNDFPVVEALIAHELLCDDHTVMQNEPEPTPVYEAPTPSYDSGDCCD